jgi:hypothetical protein
MWFIISKINVPKPRAYWLNCSLKIFSKNMSEKSKNGKK